MFAIEKGAKETKTYCSSKSLTNNKITALTINSIVVLFDEEKKKVDALEGIEHIIYYVLSDLALFQTRKFTHQCYSVVIVSKWHR